MKGEELTNLINSSFSVGPVTTEDKPSNSITSNITNYSLKDLKKDSTFNKRASRFLSSIGRNSENIFEFLTNLLL